MAVLRRKETFCVSSQLLQAGEDPVVDPVASRTYIWTELPLLRGALALQHQCWTEEDICQVKEMQGASKANLTLWNFLVGLVVFYFFSTITWCSQDQAFVWYFYGHLEYSFWYYNLSIQLVKKWVECLCCHLIHLHHFYKAQVLQSSFCCSHANGWESCTSALMALTLLEKVSCIRAESW